MKKYIIYTLIVTIAVFSGLCNKDDIDTKYSIFDPIEVYEPNRLDKWLLDNYVYIYSIQVRYRLGDNETNVEYHLAPAKYDDTIASAKIVKFVWMEAYDKIWGINMVRTYAPKLLQFIGNVVYTESDVILGQAEGGVRVTLFRVDEIDKSNLSITQLNEYYSKTMHHEFTHTLNQKKAHGTSYGRMSGSNYVGSSWYRVPESIALQKGFISPCAMDRATEDLAGMVVTYVTNSASTWEDMPASTGTTGRPIIEKRFETVFDCMLGSWGLDLDKLRGVVLYRQSEITELGLSIF